MAAILVGVLRAVGAICVGVCMEAEDLETVSRAWESTGYGVAITPPKEHSGCFPIAVPYTRCRDVSSHDCEHERSSIIHMLLNNLLLSCC